ncbi:MAG: hypothetical protein JWL81_1726 [Verrucomicrobiales bacterium]|nr:hypothetical protein [Verrucomicrobiales bacterium]
MEKDKRDGRDKKDISGGREGKQEKDRRGGVR